MRQLHPRRRSYSRKYIRTPSFPPKKLYRSPAGTYRNRSTNSSHGRTNSTVSSNSTTTSPQRREYISRSSTQVVVENDKRCLRCDSTSHVPAACPRFRQYCRAVCNYCFKKRGKALYHPQALCPFRLQVGRSSAYVEPSPGTLQRRLNRRMNHLNKSNGNNRTERFKSPSNFTRTQYNSSLNAKKSVNNYRGKS